MAKTCCRRSGAPAPVVAEQNPAAQDAEQDVFEALLPAHDAESDVLINRRGSCFYCSCCCSWRWLAVTLSEKPIW